MDIVYIKDVAVGSEQPKICVPVVGHRREEILASAREVTELPADIAEWRADGYDEVFDSEKVREMLKCLRGILGEKPLLFTFRTQQEGGEKAIGADAYFSLLHDVCMSEEADVVDVELFMPQRVTKEIIETAHARGKTVIVSNHDFIKTPDKDEILRRLILMDEMQGDILKIAVMPKKTADVLELLAATEEMGRLYTEKPLVTISMGALGMISRIAGETFGSAMTFGAGAQASAPGQMPAAELKKILEQIHECMA